MTPHKFCISWKWPLPPDCCWIWEYSGLKSKFISYFIHNCFYKIVVYYSCLLNSIITALYCFHKIYQTNTGSSPFAFAPAGGGTPSFGASTPAANGELYRLLIGQFQFCCFTFFIYTKAASPSVILLPLRPVSLTHKNPQRRKIFPDMRPVGRQIDWPIWKCFL